MAAYLWLIWYDAATKAAPKHWTLAISYEAHERAYATVYEVSPVAGASVDAPFTHELTIFRLGDRWHWPLPVAGDTTRPFDE